MIKKHPILLNYFLIFLLIAGGIFLFFQKNLQPADPSSSGKVPFTIQRGENFFQVSTRLSEQKIIKNKTAFIVWILITGTNRKIQAGNYLLSPSLSSPEIARLLTKGITDIFVTIPEGLRSEEIVQILLKNNLRLNPEEWQKKVIQEKKEGRLFPDSYFIPQNASLEQIFSIFEKNFQKKVVLGLENQFKKTTLSQDKVLILASLVEREAKTFSDKALIAGILLKRLENNWPLQVDATIQYAVSSQKCSVSSKNCDWWPSKLSSKDLQINSPYNTYLYRGLPPSPICNPGLDSIKAVLDPTPSSYWFYLSGKDGAIHYARTNSEHELNKQKYLR